MTYILMIYTLSLTLFFNPLYDNYTSLRSGPYMFFYVLWIFLLTFFLYKKMKILCQTKKEMMFLNIISSLFVSGSLLPYYSSFSLFPFLHVILPMISIILYWLFLLYIIKKEPLQAPCLFQWFYYCASIVALLIVFFGHINGIIEICAIMITLFLLNKINDVP